MAGLAAAIAGFGLGSIPFGYLLVRLAGRGDVRSFGSGNIGATNVARVLGPAGWLVTLLGDAGKGWIAVALAQHFAPTWELDNDAVTAVALVVFLGHVWPVFLRFKGGKGVATATGVVFGLNPWTGLLAIVTWIIVAAIGRISSLSALMAAVLTPVYAWIFLGSEANTLVILVMSLLLIWRHKSNIANLIPGKEARIGGSDTP